MGVIRHPRVWVVYAVAVLVAGFAACRGPGADGGETGLGEVLPGIDVLLSDSIHLVLGRRVGLITNQTGLDRAGRTTIDRLYERTDVELVALFAPEHGIRGAVEGGVDVAEENDPVTGLPVYSLYGETRQPTVSMLSDLDALLFDIQDIGARFFTYLSTMALAMQTAANMGLTIIVLDRPNPIGGDLIQGPVLDPAYSSFVGLYPIPVRHGMTAGELARFYNERFAIDARLHVVPMRGWTRSTWFDDSGLHWIAPSPNMPSLESATHYPGTCLFEGTDLSVGRGTETAFQQIGAPWIDGDQLARRLNAYDLPGVRFEATRFTPRDPGDGKYDGESVSGVRFVTTDRAGYDPLAAGVAALREARALASDHGVEWGWRTAHFDRLAGSSALREAIEAQTPLEAIMGEWEADLENFRLQRERFLIY
jgi:uncharacterized protein YbbC (DUF1343 family)